MKFTEDDMAGVILERDAARKRLSECEADAQLGAALRAALATLEPEGLLSIAPLDFPHGERVWLVNGGTSPRERNEDKRLAALLTARAPHETTREE